MRLLAPLAPLLVVGCSDQGFTAFDNVDVWRQNPPDEVDILLVVDDSCSMEPYQQRLGSNFTQFISWFIEADVDYKIGVVTTDVITPGVAGRLRGPVITRDTANADAVFSEIVNVGIAGAGYETGLEAARIALEQAGDFIREEASLSVIFVSDEQDSSPAGVNEYINEFFAYKGFRNRDVFNASALVVSDLAPCNEQQKLQSTIGTRYMDVAQQTRGIVGNLCAAQQDFESIVFELSLASTRLRNTYFLSGEPDLKTLQVSVDDAVVPCEEGKWTYELVLDEQLGEERPAIVFGVNSLPPVGARITARYFDGTANPAEFCARE
jgi:hypothetical protein